MYLNKTSPSGGSTSAGRRSEGSPWGPSVLRVICVTDGYADHSSGGSWQASFVWQRPQPCGCAARMVPVPNQGPRAQPQCRRGSDERSPGAAASPVPGANVAQVPFHWQSLGRRQERLPGSVVGPYAAHAGQAGLQQGERQHDEQHARCPLRCTRRAGVSPVPVQTWAG